MSATSAAPRVTTLVAALIAAAPLARASTRPRAMEVLNCEGQLNSAIRAEVERLVRSRTLTDLDNFGGTEFLHDDERVDRVHAALPEPGVFDEPWRIERWADDAVFYDVGFKNLEEDSYDINRWVMSLLYTFRDHTVVFGTDPRRTMWYEILDRFRWGFHDGVIEEFRKRRTKRDLLGRRGFEDLVLANQHSNVDVLGVTKGFVPLTAPRSEIRRRLRISMQISQDQPLDFMRPSVDGMLRVRGAAPTAPRRLPFMWRLAADRRDDFIDGFWADYGHLRACEMARYAKSRGTPAWVEARLQLEAFRRAHRRGCQLVVASVTASTLAIFSRHRFDFDRALPTGGTEPEFLISLKVDSPEFLLTMRDLRQAADPAGRP